VYQIAPAFRAPVRVDFGFIEPNPKPTQAQEHLSLDDTAAI
jgi:hypothetical protein